MNHRLRKRTSNLNQKKGVLHNGRTRELSAKVRELKELQQLIEEATAEAETIKDELKAYMSTSGAEEMTVDVFKVRYKAVTSSRFDSTAFKAKYSELYAQFCKPATSMRFSVA